jgi:hypothetical protein
MAWRAVAKLSALGMIEAARAGEAGGGVPELVADRPLDATKRTTAESAKKSRRPRVDMTNPFSDEIN